MVHASPIDRLFAEAVGGQDNLRDAYHGGTESQKSVLERLATVAKTAADLVKSAETLSNFAMLAWQKGSTALEWLNR